MMTVVNAHGVFSAHVVHNLDAKAVELSAKRMVYPDPDSPELDLVNPAARARSTRSTTHQVEVERHF